MSDTVTGAGATRRLSTNAGLTSLFADASPQERVEAFYAGASELYDAAAAHAGGCDGVYAGLLRAVGNEHDEVGDYFVPRVHEVGWFADEERDLFAAAHGAIVDGKIAPVLDALEACPRLSGDAGQTFALGVYRHLRAPVARKVPVYPAWHSCEALRAARRRGLLVHPDATERGATVRHEAILAFNPSVPTAELDRLVREALDG